MRNFNRIQDRKVLDNYNGSDHKTIRFSVGAGQQGGGKYRNWAEADWRLFSEELARKEFFIPTLMTDKKWDILLGKIYNGINRALEKACPERDKKPNKFKNAWFTDRLETFRKRVIRSYDTLKRQASTANQVKHSTGCLLDIATP